MKRLRNHLVGVDRGEEILFSDFQDGGPMWTGEGPRSADAEVRFSEPFRSPPVVQVSLSMWDLRAGSNQRVDISAEDVTASGFRLVFHTWGDTRIARARASWLAIGELQHDDDWQVD